MQQHKYLKNGKTYSDVVNIVGKYESMLKKPTHLQDQIIPVCLRGLIVKPRQATLTGTLVNKNVFVPMKNVLHPVTNI